MRKFISISFVIMFLASAILWSGCGGIESALELPAEPAPEFTPAPESDVEGVPEWFLNVPEDPNYIYATGVGQSEDLRVAIEMANLNAHSEFSKSVRTEIQQFIAETGVATTQEISGLVTSGVRKAKSKVIKEDSMLRAYVLMEMPVEEVKVSVMMTIEANKALHAELKDSPKFKELVREVEEYRQKKEETRKAAETRRTERN